MLLKFEYFSVLDGIITLLAIYYAYDVKFPKSLPAQSFLSRSVSKKCYLAAKICTPGIQLSTRCLPINCLSSKDAHFISYAYNCIITYIPNMFYMQGVS